MWCVDYNVLGKSLDKEMQLTPSGECEKGEDYQGEETIHEKQEM